ncbi:DUF4073 domain-containing protein [Paenibacillus sp. H1-7]|uniref:DUF4073 domain-containing protein n=1 Tax=Paenibacillus sp. H1-7 TaxID=2282849 RepID=UPI001EF99438|nr:DUF4073 domain-containing protein [Paenibacillus sp. H1-7]
MSFGSRALRRWTLSLIVFLFAFSDYSSAFAADRFVLEPVAKDSVTVDPDIRYGDYISTADGGYVAAGTDAGGEDPELFMAKWRANGDLQWRTSLGFDTSGLPPAVNDVLETPNGYMFVGRMNDGMLYGLVNETGVVVQSGVLLPGGGSANFIAKMEGAGTVRYLVGGIAPFSDIGTVNSIFTLDVNGNPGAGIVHLTTYGRIPFEGLTLPSGDVAIVGYGSEGTGSSFGTLYTYSARSGVGPLKKFYSDGGSLTLQALADAGAGSGYYLIGNVLAGNEQNIVVLRTDADGNELWRKEYPHESAQVPEGLLRTRDGGFLIYGGSNAGDGVLLKTDANMNEQWFKVIPGTWNLRAALQLADGSYRVAGNSANLIDMYVGPPTGLVPDDEANVLVGLTEDMEYIGNGSVSYVVYDSGDAPTFAGNQTVFVRYKADPAAGYEVGKAASFDFTANPVSIASVSPLAGVPVEYGTPLSKIGLPATVNVGLSDGTNVSASVIWDGGNPAYDGTVPGAYKFVGTLTPPSGTTNPAALTAAVVVTVEPRTIKSVADAVYRTVGYGTPLSELRLPATVNVGLSDGTNVSASVIWNGGNPAYDGTVPGAYKFVGTLMPPSGTTNPAALTAAVVVTVEPRTIKSVADAVYRTVGYGTPLSELGLPTTVNVGLSDGTTEATGVTWDGGNPAYDGNTPGRYAFKGELMLPSGATNPGGLTATAVITVVEAPVASLPIASVVPLSAMTVDYGTPLSGLVLPTMVNVVLNDGSIVGARVSWDDGVPSYNGNAAGVYAFTGTLTPPAGVTNPEGLTATMVITVEKAPVALVGLEVDENTYHLRAGSSRAILVKASYSDGHRTDVTDAAKYTTSNASVAEVGENGVVRAKMRGTATISIEYGGLRSEIQVDVYRTSRENDEKGAAAVPTVTRKTTTACSSGGCTATFGEQVSIEIPGLPGDAIVTIEKIGLPPDSVPAGLHLASDVFELLLGTGMTFSEPVTLRFAFDAAAVPEGFLAALFYFDEAREEWVKIESRVKGGFVEASADHFAKFAVFAFEASSASPAKPTATPAPPPPRFLDMDGHWADSFVARAVEFGIANGYDARTFAPDAQVTRAQFITMLMRTLKVDSGATPRFTDADTIEAWAASAVAAAAERGIVVGFPDGTFRPNAIITRAEMTTLLVRAAGLETSGGTEPAFADAADVPTWARDAVTAAEGIGLVQGREGDRFEPSATATRAEAVVLLLRMLDLNLNP